jgi:hypothetical protein
MEPIEIHERFIALRTYTRSYWDAQRHRIGIGNREFSGVTDPATILEIKESARHTEDLLSKAMVRNYRDIAPEIYAWVDDTVGLGHVLMARLLGEVGHPVWAFPSHWEGKGDERVLVADPPFKRNVAKLWAYCGHGDPTRKLKKGMTDKELYAMGNPKARMLAHLLAESCTKSPGGVTKTGVTRQRSPYRDTYDAGRARYAGRVDAETGKEWPDGRKHNASLRLTAKDILRDLWVLADKTLA